MGLELPFPNSLKLDTFMIKFLSLNTSTSPIPNPKSKDSPIATGDLCEGISWGVGRTGSKGVCKRGTGSADRGGD